MSVQIPFPLPASGFALNSKVRINLDFLVDQFNEFNSGTATWDAVYIGTANSLTGPLVQYNSANAFSITFQAGVTDSNTTYTWPITLPSVEPSALFATTAGVMSWKQFLGTADQITITENATNLTFSTPQNLDTAADFQVSSLTVDNALAGPAASIRFTGNLTSGFHFTQNNPLNDSRINVMINGGLSGSFGTTYTRINERLEVYESDASNGGILLLANTSPYHAVMKMWTYDGVGAGPGDCYIYTTDGSNHVSFGYENGVGFSVSSATTLGTDTHFTSTTSGIQLPSGNTLVLNGVTSGAVTLDVPASVTNYNFTFPDNDGTNGYVLQTDGFGNTSWTSISAVGGATTELDNLGTVAINADLLVDTDQAYDLGAPAALFEQVHAQHHYAGRSGLQGVIYCYPPTDSNGLLQLTCVDNDTNYAITIKNAAHTFGGAGRDYTLDDVGASASFVMTAGTQTIGGTKTFSSSILVPVGAVGTPSIARLDNIDTGVYFPSTAQVAVAIDGTVGLLVDTAAVNLYTSAGITFQASATGISSYGVNSSTVPRYYWNGDENTGVGHSAADTLNLITAGASNLIINSIGAISQPSQPSFNAGFTSGSTNVTGAGTFYTVVFNVEKFDLNSDYNTSTGIFTAPVTGKYHFTAHVLGLHLTAAATSFDVYLVTSNETWVRLDVPVDPTYQQELSILCDMDASDTAFVQFRVNGEASDVVDMDTNNDNTNFSGSLIN